MANNVGAGVDLFFALSGFLITGILYDARHSPHYFRNFYVRRALRILPVYYALLTAVLIAKALMPGVRELDSVTTSTQIQNWTFTTNIAMALRGTSGPDFLSHLWSLSVEEQFYLLWPLVVLAFSKERLIKACIMGIVAAYVVRALLTARLLLLDSYVLLPARMDDLLVGALIALALRSPKGIPRWTTLPAVQFAILVLFVVNEQLISLHIPGPVGALFRAFHWTGLAAGSAFLLLKALAPEQNLMQRIFSTQALRFFGKYSYAIYLFHLPIIIAIASTIRLIPRATTGTAITADLVSIGLAALFVTVGASLVSRHLIESPFLRLKDRFAMADNPPPNSPFSPVSEVR